MTDNREKYYNKPRIKNILMYTKQNVGFFYLVSRWKIDHKIPIYILVKNYRNKPEVNRNKIRGFIKSKEMEG